MTDTFREIEKGHEAKYKLDEELHFKVQCRRNKLLGLWAANEIGWPSEQGEEYATTLVRLHVDGHGEDVVVEKVAQDFKDNGVPMDQSVVRRNAERLQSIAAEQIQNEYPKPLDSDHVQIGG